MGCEQSRSHPGYQQPAAAANFRVAPPARPVGRGVTRGSVTVSVHAPGSAGQDPTVALDVATYVGHAKRIVAQAVGADPQHLRLVLHGRNLDDSKPLSTYTINNGDTIYIASPDAQKQGVQDLLDMYEITIAQEDDLRHLQRFDIVFLVDDSGSMQTVETTAGVRQSRWAELRDTVSALIDFACVFDDDGTDIHFLNRPAIEGVTDPHDPRLKAAFDQAPGGRTPLTTRFREVVQGFPGSKPLLVVIATDGAPTDGGPSAFVKETRRLLTGRREVRLAIMACTQDDDAVEWLNDLDDDRLVGHKIDVCDDYEAEKKEVLAAGRVSQFLISDYYVKALLGPILEKYDQLDAPIAGARRVYKGAGGRQRGSKFYDAAHRDAATTRFEGFVAGGSGATLAERRAARPARSRGGPRGGDDAGPLISELTRLFVLHKTGALDARQFAAAKAAVLPAAE